jgi:1,4-dihydroxy-2-naphthoate octaprenyltransferase
MFLAACAAAPFDPAWLALAVLGIFALEVAKNASGEIFDFEVDLRVAEPDRSPFSGGKRVLVDGLLTKRQTAAIAAAGYGIGIACGIAIAILREPRVLAIGAAGVALAFFYHAPPFKLSYRGFGELAVALAYGPLIACGTFLVLKGSVSETLLLASVPLGLLIAAFLWINEFPDYAADAACGKRNLVVRLGRRAAARVFALLVLAAVAVTFALPLPLWIGAAAGVPAIEAARRLLRHPDDTARIVPAQALTLLSFVLFALATGIGFLIS